MAEDTAQAVNDDAQIDHDFDAGFSDTTKAPIAAPIEAPKPESIEPPPAEPLTLPTPAPEYVQLTKEELEALRAATNLDGLNKRIKDTLNGSLGSIEDRIVKKLQAATPQGDAIELPSDVVAEMEQDFPELADHIRKALEKTVKGMRGTGKAATDASVDSDQIKAAARAIVIENEKEALKDIHPDWADIIGVPDAQGKTPDTDFRKCLLTQPAEYQTKVNETNSSSVISRALDKFTAAKAPVVVPQPDTRTAARRDRIQAAIPPKGDGGQPPTKSAVDEFEVGFNSR